MEENIMLRMDCLERSIGYRLYSFFASILCYFETGNITLSVMVFLFGEIFFVILDVIFVFLERVIRRIKRKKDDGV